jgi:hypothetical protein
MWVSRRIDQARRRVRGSAPVAPVEAPESAIDDLALSLVRPDLERLFSGLAASLGPGRPRPDSPALLEAALTSAIARVGGRGRPTVTRSPAGLYTPEYWHIRVDGADAATRDGMARLATGARVR